MDCKFSRVYIEITNICNRACSFCPGTKRAPRRMTLAEFSVILDKLNGLTEYIYLHVMGEPLTHPELTDFIKLADRRGFKVALTTNGTLLDRVGDSLLDTPLYKINISLHSFEKGDTAAHSAYLASCFDFADRASQKGVLTVLRLWNRGFDEGRNIDVVELLRRRFPNGEWRHGARGARIRHRLHLEYDDRFSWPDMEAEYLGERSFCYGLSDHFAILCDGTVTPCCLDHDGDIPLGNVFEDGCENILASERADMIRRGFGQRRAEEELCRRCGYSRRFKI